MMRYFLIAFSAFGLLFLTAVALEKNGDTWMKFSDEPNCRFEIPKGYEIRQVPEGWIAIILPDQTHFITEPLKWSGVFEETVYVGSFSMKHMSVYDTECGARRLLWRYLHQRGYKIGNRQQ